MWDVWCEMFDGHCPCVEMMMMMMMMVMVMMMMMMVMMMRRRDHNQHNVLLYGSLMGSVCK